MEMIRQLAVCICTYGRPRLLARLVHDLAAQHEYPSRLIVVDGDSASNEVRKVLASLNVRWRIIYVPSNHSNLPYQRYLGWRLAAGCRWLLYLDDDLRIVETDTVEKIIAPLAWTHRNVVGVTAGIVMGDPSAFASHGVLKDRVEKTAVWESQLVRWFGSGRRTPPGGLTPVGDRRMPERSGPYVTVKWLSGGVMVYRMDALTQECFSDVLFATYRAGCGRGEDTLLSRCAGAKGELLLAWCATVEHPHDDAPRCYPTDARRYGHAVAYSRRLLNDQYRVFCPPRVSDRLHLIKTYVGNTALSWIRALTRPRKHRWEFALGYTTGAVRGLVHRPRCADLAPGVDWWADAETALDRTLVIHEGSVK